MALALGLVLASYAVAHLKDILPLLARARAALEHGYECLIETAKHEPLPCDAIVVYTETRRDLLRQEDLIVNEARTHDLHPPEDVPRGLALLGACAPGAGDVKLSKDQLDLGANYIEAVKHRAKLSDEALRLGYGKEPEFAAHARKLVEYLAPYAQAGTDEAAPAPPRNLTLLRLFYYLGGTIWPVPEADQLWRLETINVTTEEALTLYRRALIFERNAEDLAEEAKPDPPLLSGKGWAMLGGGLAVAAAGIGTLAWKLNRRSGGGHDDDDGPPAPDPYAAGRTSSLNPWEGDKPQLPAHGG